MKCAHLHIQTPPSPPHIHMLLCKHEVSVLLLSFFKEENNFHLGYISSSNVIFIAINNNSNAIVNAIIFFRNKQFYETITGPLHPAANSFAYYV